MAQPGYKRKPAVAAQLDTTCELAQGYITSIGTRWERNTLRIWLFRFDLLCLLLAGLHLCSLSHKPAAMLCLGFGLLLVDSLPFRGKF